MQDKQFGGLSAVLKQNWRLKDLGWNSEVSYFQSIWSRKLPSSPGSARCFGIQTAMSQLWEPAVYLLSKGLSLCLFTWAAGRYVAAYLTTNRKINGPFEQSSLFQQRRRQTSREASSPLWRSGKEWATEEQSGTKTEVLSQPLLLTETILLFIPAHISVLLLLTSYLCVWCFHRVPEICKTSKLSVKAESCQLILRCSDLCSIRSSWLRQHVPTCQSGAVVLEPRGRARPPTLRSPQSDLLCSSSVFIVI